MRPPSEVPVTTVVVPGTKTEIVRLTALGFSALRLMDGR
jgi:hypothetical protein